MCVSVGVLMTSLFSQRTRLELVTSMRGGLRRVFSNGQSKQISGDIVSIVRRTGVCPKHNLCLNVSVIHLTHEWYNIYICDMAQENQPLLHFEIIARKRK